MFADAISGNGRLFGFDCDGKIEEVLDGFGVPTVWASLRIFDDSIS